MGKRLLEPEGGWYAILEAPDSRTDEDWALVQRAYGRLTEPGVFTSKKIRRVLDWPTDQFLRKQAYLRFREVKRPARKAPRPPSTEPTPESLEEIGAQLLARDEYILQLLADPEAPEIKKEETRNRWLADARNKDRVAPWQVTSKSVGART